jgi:RHS repeat-associated protein
MKKILIPIGALLVSGLVHSQTTGASSTENYVESRTYLEPVTTSSSTARQIQAVQYFDGLGRPKQVVNVKASPLGKDVVTHIEYDGFGRQAKDYLPVPQQGTQNGAIYTSPLSNATQPVLYGSEKIYAEKILENSPLDRVLQQKQVGTAWNDKPLQFGYDANTTGDAVKKYVTVTTWENEATKSEISQSVNYGNAQLYKNTVTDEDGNVTIEFKNGQGQVILVRKILIATSGAGTDTDKNADTYYVYNEYNQLAFVIPPLAAVIGTIDETTLNNLCYQYKYDGRGRLVKKKLPGKGLDPATGIWHWDSMVYDKADRLILTQDANLEVQGKWFMTKYDPFGRVAYTAIISGGDRANMQSQAGNLVIVESRNNSGFTKDGMQVQYSNNYFNALEKVLSVNYYDTYPSYSFNPPFPTDILNEPALTDTPTAEGLSTKSLPVMSLVKNIEDDNWTKNYTYYDKKGRSIGSYSINHLGGRTKVDSRLDFAGVVQQAVTTHKRLDTDTDRVITENFTYDNQNRLLTHTHKVDNNFVETLAQNTYNELSQLSNKKVGGYPSLNGGGFLQSIDYAYNIRGWMTKINDPANLNGKLFGYSIKYDQPQTESWYKSYNGNISEVDWKTSQDGVLRRYAYAYDSLNRLTAGVYVEPNSSIVWVDYYSEYYRYDLNGNITTLSRFSKPSSGNNPERIDYLAYNYTGNRLDKITLPPGIVNNPSGYNALENAFTYDLNGNMTSHLDRGISSIAYNYLNLPSVITNGTGKMKNYMKYIYRADGTKVRKYPSGSYVISSPSTDYLDGFQYITTNDICLGCVRPLAELQFVPTSEGYFDFVESKYIYNYTDHLGNVRLSYFNDGNTAEILEESHYYPFGLKHEGYNTLVGNPSYQYKYNGKELQENGMYDYGARFYMPDIGRWGVVDPLAETSRRWSPYTYAYNNPIRFIDPDGRTGTDWVGKTDANGSTQWHWEDNIKSASQAASLNYDRYSDGKTNNTYTSNSGSEVTLKTEGNWSEDFTNVNRERLGAAINNCTACKQLEGVEKALFIGIPVALATGGVGGFAFSSEMTATAIGGRFLTDASVQTAANYSTNGGNIGEALGNVNLTQSTLAGLGMSYIGNAVISTAVNVNATDTKSIFTGGVSARTYVTQAGLSIVGGTAVNRVTGSSAFKSTVIGSYMRTTSSFGQTAGTTVANVLMNTPDYTRATLQNKVP